MPIQINKNGSPVAVMMSVMMSCEEYEQLEALVKNMNNLKH
ncbi:hypothetical protein AB6D20_028040 (plasmid) [Vibrio splendidus]